MLMRPPKRMKMGPSSAAAMQTSPQGYLYYPVDEDDVAPKIEAIARMMQSESSALLQEEKGGTDEPCWISENLKYLLNARFFGVRNPNSEFITYCINEGSFVVFPAPNSWDWDRMEKVVTRYANDNKISILVRRLAQVKLCQREGLPFNSDKDMSALLPKAWASSNWWKSVFRGTYMPPQQQQQQKKSGEENAKPSPVPLVTFPKVLDYEAVMDEARLQDVFYQHLLKQFDSNGSTINIFGKTICPNIHKAQRDLDIADRVKRLVYDYICELDKH
ncbi:hypothetical protein MRX96_031917 [Rhipicephalus microplus]